MAEVSDLDQAISKYIRPQTFPVAVKMLGSEDEIPEKTRRPYQQMRKRIAICQGIGMARKYGWAIAMGKEDMQCALGAAPFGFFKDISFFEEGNMAEGMFTVSKDVGKTEEDLIDRFEHETYSHILVAPLFRTVFEPDLYMMYGNPAQIMRLIHGVLYNVGGSVQSSAMGRLGCATIITAIEKEESRYIVPGNGDRIFGMTQDHEMAFILHPSDVDNLIDGLEKTHKAGIRYPITSFFDFEPTLPPSYQEQMKIWEEAGELAETVEGC